MRDETKAETGEKPKGSRTMVTRTIAAEHMEPAYLGRKADLIPAKILAMGQFSIRNRRMGHF
jgi:hypothetical protein